MQGHAPGPGERQSLIRASSMPATFLGEARTATSRKGARVGKRIRQLFSQVEARIMSTGFALVGIEGLRRNWVWALALGVALIVLGVVALGAPFVVSLTSVLFFGWLLILSGALQTAHGFWRRKWSGFFLDLLAGVLYLVVGFMFIDQPLEALATVTMIIAAALMFVGVMRVVVALSSHFQHWVWLLLNGIISLVLGLLIFKGWPETSLWVIGLFIGIDMLFYGWALVMLSLGVRSLPAQTA
jgi:uncharacterized membrane protein HdeD (DUF308 family)